MLTPEAFYLICKGLALLGAAFIGQEMVVVLAGFLWYLARDLKNFWKDED